MEFDKIYCITLARRPDRWHNFLDGLPEGFEQAFGKVEKWLAYDGRIMHSPPYWHGGNGAWGCYNSHKRAIEQAIIERAESVLLFEDDALFLPDFIDKTKAFLDKLPKGAEIVYLGGQHLKRQERQPQKVNDLVYRPYNVNRTHAWGIIGQGAMLKVLDHLNKRNWTTPHHIDHWMGALLESGKVKAFCPARWLVDQREGRSDVAQREKVYTHWKDADTAIDITKAPFIAIIGLHSSGSSALAGALYHLNLHLGNRLVGMYGNPPINGGEAEGLARLFEAALPVPKTEWIVPVETVKKRLLTWINERQREAVRRGKVAAGKYPQLAATADFLPDILGDNLKIIHIDRPIEESIRSLQRRFRNVDPKSIEAHQRRLYQGAALFKEKVKPENYCKIEYAELLKKPFETLESIPKSYGIEGTIEQLEAAARYIDPAKRHEF